MGNKSSSATVTPQSGCCFRPNYDIGRKKPSPQKKRPDDSRSLHSVDTSQSGSESPMFAVMRTDPKADDPYSCGADLPGDMKITVNIVHQDRAYEALVKCSMRSMDFLEQLAGWFHFSVTDYTLQAAGLPKDFTSSTQIGALRCDELSVVPKNRGLYQSQISRDLPFVETRRVIVNLPANQLWILRVDPLNKLEDIKREVCVAKDLSPDRFHLVRPFSSNQTPELLDLGKSLDFYRISDVTMLPVEKYCQLLKQFSADEKSKLTSNNDESIKIVRDVSSNRLAEQSKRFEQVSQSASQITGRQFNRSVSSSSNDLRRPYKNKPAPAPPQHLKGAKSVQNLAPIRDEENDGEENSEIDHSINAGGRSSLDNTRSTLDSTGKVILDQPRGLYRQNSGSDSSGYHDSMSRSHTTMGTGSPDPPSMSPQPTHDSFSQASSGGSLQFLVKDSVAPVPRQRTSLALSSKKRPAPPPPSSSVSVLATPTTTTSNDSIKEDSSNVMPSTKPQSDQEQSTTEMTANTSLETQEDSKIIQGDDKVIALAEHIQEQQVIPNANTEIVIETKPKVVEEVAVNNNSHSDEAPVQGAPEPTFSTVHENSQQSQEENSIESLKNDVPHQEELAAERSDSVRIIASSSNDHDSSIASLPDILEEDGPKMCSTMLSEGEDGGDVGGDSTTVSLAEVQASHQQDAEVSTKHLEIIDPVEEHSESELLSDGSSATPATPAKTTPTAPEPGEALHNGGKASEEAALVSENQEECAVAVVDVLTHEDNRDVQSCDVAPEDDDDSALDNQKTRLNQSDEDHLIVAPSHPITDIARPVPAKRTITRSESSHSALPSSSATAAAATATPTLSQIMENIPEDQAFTPPITFSPRIGKKPQLTRQTSYYHEHTDDEECMCAKFEGKFKSNLGLFEKIIAHNQTETDIARKQLKERHLRRQRSEQLSPPPPPPPPTAAVADTPTTTTTESSTTNEVMSSLVNSNNDTITASTNTTTPKVSVGQWRASKEVDMIAAQEEAKNASLASGTDKIYARLADVALEDLDNTLREAENETDPNNNRTSPNATMKIATVNVRPARQQHQEAIDDDVVDQPTTKKLSVKDSIKRFERVRGASPSVASAVSHQDLSGVGDEHDASIVAHPLRRTQSRTIDLAPAPSIRCKPNITNFKIGSLKKDFSLPSPQETPSPKMKSNVHSTSNGKTIVNIGSWNNPPQNSRPKDSAKRVVNLHSIGHSDAHARNDQSVLQTMFVELKSRVQEPPVEQQNGSTTNGAATRVTTTITSTPNSLDSSDPVVVDNIRVISSPAPPPPPPPPPPSMPTLTSAAKQTPSTTPHSSTAGVLSPPAMFAPKGWQPQLKSPTTPSKLDLHDVLLDEIRNHPVARLAKVAKVRLQVAQTRLLAGGKKMRYNGVFGTLFGIVKNEGFRTLYHGISPSLQRQCIFASIRLGTYDLVRDFYVEKFAVDVKTQSTASSMFIRMISALTTGVIGISCAQPTDVVKIRMQAHNQEGPLRYKSSFQAYQNIYRTQGVKGLWRGWVPNIIRNGTVNVVELVAYDLAKEFFLRNRVFKDNPYCHFTSALVAGLGASFVSSPLDVVKTNFMNSTKGTYSSILHCVISIAKQGGIKAFYRGVWVAFLRLSSWNITMRITFEQFKRLCEQNSDGSINSVALFVHPQKQNKQVDKKIELVLPKDQ